MCVYVAGVIGVLGSIATGGRIAPWIENLRWLLTRRPSVVFGVQTAKRFVALLLDPDKL